MIPVLDTAFADALRRAMRGRGLTQEALEERSGVAQTTIGNILRGSDPRLSTIGRLAAALPELLEATQ